MAAGEPPGLRLCLRAFICDLHTICIVYALSLSLPVHSLLRGSEMRRGGPGLQFLLRFHGKSLLIAVLIYCLSARLILFPSAGDTAHAIAVALCAFRIPASILKEEQS